MRVMRYSTVAASEMRKRWTRTTGTIGCTSLLLLQLPSSACCFGFHQRTHITHHHYRHHYHHNPSLLLHNEMTTMTSMTTNARMIPASSSPRRSFMITTTTTTTRLSSSTPNDSDNKSGDGEIPQSSKTSSIQQQLATTVGSSTTTNANDSKGGGKTTINWNDRIQLQNLWTNVEKGWLNVNVEWKESKYGGIGLFSTNKDVIPKGTVLRYGLVGKNLVQFHSLRDIEEFLQQSSSSSYDDGDDDDTYHSRLMYVKDYLWGLNLYTDERGYTMVDTSTDDDAEDDDDDVRDRFFGMWYV